jgi:Tol biopolymer transport system component
MLAGAPAVGSSGDLTIAPADAAGSIVYWRTVKADNTGQLKGFSAGDESVVLALQASDVLVKPGGQSVTCIGCHTSTPAGKHAAFKTLGDTKGGALAGVANGITGQPPSYWSAASITAMNSSSFGVPSFSKAHWTDGDRVLVTSWGNNNGAQLAWFDLQATSSAQGVAFGVLARTGDPRGGIMPTLSHDGKTVVYISTNSSIDGRAAGDGDIYSIPYADRMGGAAAPIQGAADPNYNEYYPSLSPDDQVVAFNRIAAGTDPYNQPAAEVFVVPTKGGMAQRLNANDPVSCSGTTSPGVTNSWPKWAPEATQVGDRTFYWLAFSSTRGGSVPQLYVTAIVAKGGQLTTYPAVHIWPQPSDEANHTPAWDVFDIPPPN